MAVAWYIYLNIIDIIIVIWWLSDRRGTGMSIKVLIADDHQMMREGLRAMLEKEHDINVLGEAEDGRMIQRMARELRPDVIIMDVAMPDLNGIEATRQIVAELPGVKIIALSMHDDRRFVLNMLKAGAAGYMLKDCAFKDLAKAIRVVMSQKTYLSHEVADIVVKDYLSSNNPKNHQLFICCHPESAKCCNSSPKAKPPPNRRKPAYQRQNRRNPSPTDHGQIKDQKRCRAHQIRHPRRLDLCISGYPTFLIQQPARRAEECATGLNPRREVLLPLGTRQPHLLSLVEDYPPEAGAYRRQIK